MNIRYVTTNDYKYELAKHLLYDASEQKISLSQANLETPEIQSFSVEEISRTSALWAANKIGSSVLKMDVGFSINALRGFPGPYIKFVNYWLSPNDLLHLMASYEDRTCFYTDALTYATPDGVSKTFVAKTFGSIAQRDSIDDHDWSIDAVFIPDGADKTLAEMYEKEKQSVWKTHVAWKQAVEYILSQEVK